MVLDGCVAIAQVTINDAIKLTGIKLVENKGNRYVSYPRNMSNKNKKSYFFPVNTDTSNLISERLWKDYDAIVKKEEDK